MTGKPAINRDFVTKPLRDPRVESARKARLERERAQDALEAMKSLQRQMRELAYERLYGTKPPEAA